jgi:hypothetical protein
VTEYVFRKPNLLDEVIKTAIEDHTFRSDDLEFTFAARVSSTYSFVSLILLGIVSYHFNYLIVRFCIMLIFVKGLVRLCLLWQLRILPRSF